MSIRIEAVYADGSTSKFKVEYVVGASFRKEEERPISFKVPIGVLTEHDIMYLECYAYADSENSSKVVFYS